MRKLALPSCACLKPPADGVINVAFIVSDQTALIDLAGPWEVFGDTMLAPHGGPWRGGGDMIMPFNLYSVSDSLKPISVAGLQVVPNYTFENAPKPQVIVVPAQGGRSEAQKRWLLENARTADINDVGVHWRLHARRLWPPGPSKSDHPPPVRG
jgi:transcriptional regulator GlxA family with amidase domain